MLCWSKLSKSPHTGTIRRRRWIRWGLLWSMLLLGWCSAGCQPDGLRGGTYYKFGGKLKYKVGGIGGIWRQIEITENDMAYYHRGYKATIQINATCRKDYEDVSLSTLVGHTMIGLRERKVLLQTRRMVDGRAALYTELAGKLDGVAFKMASLVMKKNECIFDFSYVTLPHNFGRGLGDFYRVLYGFKVIS